MSILSDQNSNSAGLDNSNSTCGQQIAACATKAFAGLALMSTAGAAYAYEPKPDMTAVATIELCTEVFKQPTKARAMLQSKGWIARVSKDKHNAVYNEPEAGFFEKDDAVIIFILQNTSVGRTKDGYRGTCQAIFPGNSPIAATAIAAHFQKAAESYRSAVGDVSHSFNFSILGYLVNLANVSDKTDSTKITGAMRILVAPE